jgi:REP element-mobilizing transposase RayT
MHLNRKSQRKKDYDYSQPSYYSVTRCTQNKLCLFGDTVKGDMLLNNAGRMVTDTWRQIPQRYAGIELDTFQIMPNHIHGIIAINPVGVGPCAHPHPRTEIGRPQGAAPTRVLSLSNVVERFKSLTTYRYIEGVRNEQWQSFPGNMWQRNFHDRIIRDELELNKIRTYICNNPDQWNSDENNIHSKPQSG